MVHVLPSMFKPFGRLGEVVHEVALVTLVMPLFAVVVLPQVSLPESKTGEPWLVLLPPSPNCP